MCRVSPPQTKASLEFDLAPRKYSVRVLADGHRMERGFYLVNLYHKQSMTIRLLPIPQEPSNRSGMESFAVNTQSGGCRISFDDPVLKIELIDAHGKILGSRPQLLEVSDLEPGFYRVRVLGPSGPLVQEDIEVAFGNDSPLDIELTAPPLPKSGLFREILDGAAIPVENNLLNPAEEAIGGRIASVELSTLLALAGGAANEDTPYDGHLHNLGVPPFQALAGSDAAQGVQFLAAIEGDSPEAVGRSVEALQFRCWPFQPNSAPGKLLALRPFGPSRGLATAASALPAGPVWLAIVPPSGRPHVVASAILPDRLTLVVVHLDSTGRIRMTQFFPRLQPAGIEDFDTGAGQPAAIARFPILRQIDLVERSYANAMLDQAYQYCQTLLSARWLDPMAGCLGSYLLLRRLEQSRRGAVAEGMRLLDAASQKLLSQFESLSDSHVIRAEYLSRAKKPDEARKAYHEAFQRGLPTIRDGLERLVRAAELLAMAHAGVEGARTLYDHGARGLLWPGASVRTLMEDRPLEIHFSAPPPLPLPETGQDSPR